MIVFLRLEKVDFGGVRGQMLSDWVLQLYNEFMELTNAFQSRGDDPLDIDNNMVSSLILIFH